MREGSPEDNPRVTAPQSQAGKDDDKPHSSQPGAGSLPIKSDSTPGMDDRPYGEGLADDDERVVEGPSESDEGGPPGGNGDVPATGDEGSPPKKKRSLIIDILVMLVIAAIIAILIQSFALKAFMIPSSSMSPTLKIGDRVLVDRVTYYFRDPRRGDVVVFRYPPRDGRAMNTSNPFYWPFEQIAETLHLSHRGTTTFIKRVIGLGGQTIEARGGKVLIDGKEIEEGYLPEGTVTDDFGPVEIPEGHLFLMGDNRGMSNDSRWWGTVPERSLVGRAFLIWWPLSRIGTL